MSSWGIGNFVRPVGMKMSNDVYQIIGEEGNCWIMYGYRYLGGGYHDGLIPKSVEFVQMDDGSLGWQKMTNSRTIRRPSNKQFEMFKDM